MPGPRSEIPTRRRKAVVDALLRDQPRLEMLEIIGVVVEVGHGTIRALDPVKAYVQIIDAP